MSVSRRCPFCHEKFDSIAAVIAHVESRNCVAAQHNKEDLHFRIETSLIRLELQVGHQSDVTDPSN